MAEVFEHILYAVSVFGEFGAKYSMLWLCYLSQNIHIRTSCKSPICEGPPAKLLRSEEIRNLEVTVAIDLVTGCQSTKQILQSGSFLSAHGVAPCVCYVWCTFCCHKQSTFMPMSWVINHLLCPMKTSPRMPSHGILLILQGRRRHAAFLSSAFWVRPI